MPADAERRAEVAGDGPDVRAGRALHGDVHVEPLGLVDRADREDLEATDRHPAGGQIHALSGADPRVGADTVHLDGADRARNLVKLADEVPRPPPVPPPR